MSSSTSKPGNEKEALRDDLKREVGLHDDTFRFMDLPLELRRMIWEESILLIEPRVFEGTKDFLYRRTCHEDLSHVAFRTCRESRQVALAKSELVPQNTMWSRTSSRTITLYFTPKIDIFYMRSCAALKNFLLSSERCKEAYQNLGVLWKQLQDSMDIWKLVNGVIRWLPNLTTILVLIPEGEAWENRELPIKLLGEPTDDTRLKKTRRTDAPYQTWREMKDDIQSVVDEIRNPPKIVGMRCARIRNAGKLAENV